MLKLLWLIPALPCAGFLTLAFFGPRLSRRAVALIGPGVVLASAVVSWSVAMSFFLAPPPGGAFVQELWTWMDVAGFHPKMALYLDPLSLVMMLVVTSVGFLIHWYSTEFMAEDEGYSRFFAYMNLFVASMLVLLLGDNLLLLYLGWEGVGLCSYLLIGFWYTDPANGRAARKAFYVTRVGDTAMSLGLFLLFTQLGTLQIQDLMREAHDQWGTGSKLATAAGLLLLGGACGKSAQLPLQVWLPDAMAGPTPTSALIHAATMVTAGVYLIARTHVIFEVSPTAQFAVAAVGAATLLIAGFSAMTQWDIKKSLAFSTISQIGYMFLALGVGAWSAAIFHFMTHAFFKALLFLGAGIVIEACHHEHSMFKMGGLRKELPVTFWTFAIAGCSLAGLPLVTAGFYSKGLIIWNAYASAGGSMVLWLAAVFGALLTSIYTFRMIFLTFFGEPKAHVVKRPGAAMKIPVMILAFFAAVAGFVETPGFLGHAHVFSNFMQKALPEAVERRGLGMSELGSEAVVMLAFLAGLAIAYFFFLKKPALQESVTEPPVGQAVHRFWFSDWGMDWLYDKLFVQPLWWFARINKRDFIDSFYAAVAAVTRALWVVLRSTQTGRLRWYAAVIVAGTILFVALALVAKP
ncbi:MAG: NADH-quinone oxidoreductase subunit L [Acidobacteria bacterium]|nr:MAG: NADH-quinone oxidoreductase subunit L [Acidobacteriota bacterium]